MSPESAGWIGAGLVVLVYRRGHCGLAVLALGAGNHSARI